MYLSEFNSFYLNSISLFTEAEAQSLNPQVDLGPPGQHSGSHFTREKPWAGPGLHGATILGHLVIIWPTMTLEKMCISTKVLLVKTKKLDRKKTGSSVLSQISWCSVGRPSLSYPGTGPWLTMGRSAFCSFLPRGWSLLGPLHCGSHTLHTDVTYLKTHTDKHPHVHWNTPYF